ncbi:anthranilate synthase component 1 [Sphingomonas sp. RB1R13]|uniref:anthranilate synthase component 1 n=1 Tax=Sphingomonas sp. RB1R13 TaxID=3096159 RepID=UPI002FC8559E
MSTLGAGTAASLVRRLAGPVVARDLHAALLADGKGTPPLFIQRTGGPALIVEAAAIKAVCRGQEVVLTALTESGRVALAGLSAVLGDAIATRADDRLVARFTRCDAPEEFDRAHARSPFDVLRALAFGHVPQDRDEPFALTAAGVVGFDHVDLFEDLPAGPTSDFPDYVFWLAESLVVVDATGAGRLICTAFGSDDATTAHRQRSLAQERLSNFSARIDFAREIGAPAMVAEGSGEAEVTTDLDDAGYADVVARLKDNVAAGDVFQVVPSRAFRTPCADPAAAFARLAAADPSRYLFFVDSEFGTLFGASPETAVAVRRDGDERIVVVTPIAGTRPRGKTIDEDDRMEADLRLDAKEVAEHMMLVDLARNDVARVAEPGTRRVATLLSVERFARVMHLVSRVEGRLETDRDAIDALIACVTCGTLSGAPKLRALELIRAAETSARGPYGGAVGWIASDGSMDTSIVIRSALVVDGIAEVRAGAGVVHDSDPVSETAETRQKASAILAAIKGFSFHAKVAA